VTDVIAWNGPRGTSGEASFSIKTTGLLEQATERRGVMNREVSEELDWVSERARCSIYVVFKALAAGARSDIDRRNELRTTEEQQRGLRFVFKAENDRHFVVKWQVLRMALEDLFFTGTDL
jgi:hypothetical protein